MKDGPIYVYDVSEQFMEPIFVAYDTDHVAVFAQALGINTSGLYVSKERLHPYEGNRYRNTGGREFLPQPKTKVNLR